MVKKIEKGNLLLSGKNTPTDWSGKIIGSITVLYPTEKRDKTRSIIWVCQCRCGNVLEFPARYISRVVRNGGSLSCKKCKLNNRNTNNYISANNSPDSLIEWARNAI